MRAKGTAVKPTLKFVQEKFPDRFQEWFDALPEASKDILSKPIMSSSWYPALEAIIIPTQKVGELFFTSPYDAAMEIGKFSALDGLTGVYKFFFRFSSIPFIFKRAPMLFSAYYDRVKFELIKVEDHYGIIKLSEIEESYELIIYRTAGWIKTVPVLLGKPEGEVEFTKKRHGNFLEVIITAKWQD